MKNKIKQRKAGKAKKHSHRPVRLNETTGKPRKWICYNHSAIDSRLQEVEVCYFYGRGPGGIWMNLPLDLLLNMTDSAERRAVYMRRVANERQGAQLTESELRYCELEGIKPEDYRKAL